VICCEAEAENFTTLVYSILLSIGKNVLKVTETLWKNSLIIAKDVGIINANHIVIAITFSEKKLEALLSYYPLYISVICYF
jgi:hypothetical protein